jgi:uncharacterized membrane protein YqhA
MAQTKKVKKLIEKVEHALEHFLWYYRLIIFLGVIGLLISSAIVFMMGLIETYHIAILFISELINNHGHIGDVIYIKLIVGIITTVDDFLLGIVLLIFGLGTYDLFISRIDPAEQQDDIRPDWLVFRSLDELKSVLGKVVLMIMIITFLKFVVNSDIQTPLDLLYLGGAIALVSLALKLSHGKDIDRSTIEDRIKKLAGQEQEK